MFILRSVYMRLGQSGWWKCFYGGQQVFKELSGGRGCFGQRDANSVSFRRGDEIHWTSFFSDGFQHFSTGFDGFWATKANAWERSGVMRRWSRSSRKPKMHFRRVKLVLWKLGEVKCKKHKIGNYSWRWSSSCSIFWGWVWPRNTGPTQGRNQPN